jgi:hypothetical protein
LAESGARRLPGWLILLLALLVPGSGHVFLGRPSRGLVMLFWMVIFGYVTFRLAPPQAGFIGKISGGAAVWALSVVDVARMLGAKSRPRT